MTIVIGPLLFAGTISLLSSIATAITKGTESSSRESEEEVDRKKMWDVEEFHDSDYTFLKTGTFIPTLYYFSFYSLFEYDRYKFYV